jgi:hypothetical protein
MRRADRAIPLEEAKILLSQGTSGVLALSGDQGWPYAVPLNYILWEDKVCFHCAKAGYKLDAIAQDPRVCFTVVLRDQLVSNHITTLYESVMVFGRAQVVEDEAQRQAILNALVDTLGDVPEDLKAQYIAKKAKNTTLVAITPEQITGKASHVLKPVTERL